MRVKTEELAAAIDDWCTAWLRERPMYVHRPGTRAQVHAREVSGHYESEGKSGIGEPWPEKMPLVPPMQVLAERSGVSLYHLRQITRRETQWTDLDLAEKVVIKGMARPDLFDTDDIEVFGEPNAVVKLRSVGSRKGHTTYMLGLPKHIGEFLPAGARFEVIETAEGVLFKRLPTVIPPDPPHRRCDDCD